MRPDTSEWAGPDHAHSYLERQDQIPHRAEAESVLVELLPDELERTLDLGTGDGRLLSIVLAARPGGRGIGVDMSPPMLAAARRRFSGETKIEIVDHDLNDPLPELGSFDAIVSSFAIHHCPDVRKREIYAECWDRLNPGGVLLNLEHVTSPTDSLHFAFLAALGMTPAEEDRSNQLLDVWTQLDWLRDLGFDDVDCYWKWRELALLGGTKPSGAGRGAS